VKIVWIRTYWREVLVATLYVLPTLSLLPLGFVWLMENHGSLIWAAVLLTCSTAASALLWLRPHKSRAQQSVELEPGRPGWGAAENSAWLKVQGFANEAPLLSLNNFDHTTDTLHKTLTLVANTLHADSNYAIGKFTIPEALLAAETLCRTTRVKLLSDIPAIQKFYVSRGMWLNDMYDRIAPFVPATMLGYRALRAVLNPASALIREASTFATDKGASVLSKAVYSKITRTVILDTGRTAIDLYSGRFHLTDKDIELFRKQYEESLRETPAPLPIRVLLAGQVNAGKSSLINAMAGTMRAPVNPLPTGGGVKRFRVSPEGKPTVDLIEAPGLSNDPATAKVMLDEALNADLIMWVAAAAQPARAIDVAALGELRHRLSAQIGRPAPPILLVVTQIDRLRPTREWTPPYNINTPDTPKAATIRDALEAAAKALESSPSATIAVAVPENAVPYQIDLVWAGVVMLLPQAQQTQLNKLLGEARSNWNIGEILATAFRSGTSIASEVMGQLNTPEVLTVLAEGLRHQIDGRTFDGATDVVHHVAKALFNPLQSTPESQDHDAHR